MASTYSDRLKLELMETGANANTWGNNTNTNLETLDAFSAGYLSKSVAGSANVTLTSNNADPTAEASNKVLDLNGTLTGNIHVFLPATESFYTVFNNTSGAFSLTVAATGHAANGVTITQGTKAVVYCDGASNYNVKIASGTDAALLDAGTISDSRLSANVTLNNASTISAGTLADARLTANVTLNNASTISAGTLSNDRLDTVPTTKGGTGLTSIGSAGQVLTVASPGTSLEFADAGGFGGYNIQVFNSPGTYNPPASLSSVKVTVQAGGGGAGGSSSNEYPSGGGAGGAAIEAIPSASIPGPVSVTVGSAGSAGNGGGPAGNAGGSGGSSSFGAFLSATGGAGGTGATGGAARAGGAGGSGSGGDYNQSGGAGGPSKYHAMGGGSLYAQGGTVGVDEVPGPASIGKAGISGSGGGGAGRQTGGQTGGAGGAGFVIVEEYLG